MNKRYYLGGSYPDVYFTQREVECAMYLLKHSTINEVADILSLSPRTIEFYVNRMKAKLECKKLRDLLIKIRESNFAKFLN